MNKTILATGTAFFLILIAGYVFFVPNENPTVPVQEPAEVESGEEQAEESQAPGERTVSLFYYNPALDQDASGNVMCTPDGLVPVSRTIASATPIEDTIRLLLRGDLTAAERAQGITTEYPLQGVTLSSVALSEDGSLRIALNDPERRTGGGSCRAAVLWAQIRATALQFPGVEEVSFQPEDLFQP